MWPWPGKWRWNLLAERPGKFETARARDEPGLATTRFGDWARPIPGLHRMSQ
jgi:hypothetical protein